MLLVVDSLCVCDTRARFSTEPVEIKYILCCLLKMQLQQSSLVHKLHVYTAWSEKSEASAHFLLLSLQCLNQI